MLFKDRTQAAQKLAIALAAYRGKHPLILAIPRGAAPMAAIIARELGGEMDVVLVRKLRAPGNPEFAIGSVDESGRVYLADYAARVGANESYLQQDVAAQRTRRNWCVRCQRRRLIPCASYRARRIVSCACQRPRIFARWGISTWNSRKWMMPRWQRRLLQQDAREPGIWILCLLLSRFLSCVLKKSAKPSLRGSAEWPEILSGLYFNASFACGRAWAWNP